MTGTTDTKTDPRIEEAWAPFERLLRAADGEIATVGGMVAATDPSSSLGMAGTGGVTAAGDDRS